MTKKDIIIKQLIKFATDAEEISIDSESKIPFWSHTGSPVCDIREDDLPKNYIVGINYIIDGKPLLYMIKAEKVNNEDEAIGFAINDLRLAESFVGLSIREIETIEI